MNSTCFPFLLAKWWLINGIRNAVINNFSLIGQRTDTGALWENFLLGERRKILADRKGYGDAFFRRTTQQQEIDYIETRPEGLLAWEFKWNPAKKGRIPRPSTGPIRKPWSASSPRLITGSFYCRNQTEPSCDSQQP